MADYHFVTVWQVRVPIERAWDAIYRSEDWPGWWKGVVKVTKLHAAGEDGLGGLTRYVWKGALPYTLTIDTTTTRLDKPRAMDGHSTGELEGQGRWRFTEEDGVTTIRYEWDVATTKPWMNLMAPLLRLPFAWNHDLVMRHGWEGLRRLLEEPLPVVRNFNPDRLAYLEAAVWKAYYAHRWLAALWLTVELVRQQFGLTWWRAIEAAYCSTRAAIAWAPVRHDVELVREYLRRFYWTARQYGEEFRFDPGQVANLELAYWVAHRELAGRPESEKGPLEDSLAELHAALFGLPLATMRASGVQRARAADAVDEITSRRSSDVELDWARVERRLRDCYGSIARALAAK